MDPQEALDEALGNFDEAAEILSDALGISFDEAEEIIEDYVNTESGFD